MPNTRAGQLELLSQMLDAGLLPEQSPLTVADVDTEARTVTITSSNLQALDTIVEDSVVYGTGVGRYTWQVDTHSVSGAITRESLNRAAEDIYRNDVRIDPIVVPSYIQDIYDRYLNIAKEYEKPKVKKIKRNLPEWW